MTVNESTEYKFNLFRLGPEESVVDGDQPVESHRLELLKANFGSIYGTNYDSSLSLRAGSLIWIQKTDTNTVSKHIRVCPIDSVYKKEYY